MLVPFRRDHARTVAGWVRTLDEAAAWATLDRLPDDATFERWHADPDVHPFLFLDGAGAPVAYGEVWEDPDEDEAEIARLIVDPSQRGRGIGRVLARALADEGHRRGFAAVWLRVVPSNAGAIRAYGAAGFVRAPEEQEASFNVGQPVDYVWMRDATATPLKGDPGG